MTTRLLTARGGVSAAELSRNGKYFAYVEYDDGEAELYDMRSDSYQLDNAYDKAPAATIDTLSRRLAVLRKCSGASCR